MGRMSALDASARGCTGQGRAKRLDNRTTWLVDSGWKQLLYIELAALRISKLDLRTIGHP
jgi:hypothetical protein